MAEQGPIRSLRGATATSKKVTIEVEGGGPPEKESAIARLFRELGGGDKIKVYRVREGDPAYVGTIAFTPELQDALEETLQGRFGGGVYALKGFHKGDNLACATLSIEGAPKKPEDPQAAVPATPGITQKEVMELIREERAAAATASDRRVTEMGGLFTVLLNQSNLAAANQLQLIQAIAGKSTAPAAAPTGGVTEIKAYAELFKSLGWGGSDKETPSENRSMVERILEKPLTSALDKAADRLTTKMFDDNKSTTPATPSTPAPTEASSSQRLVKLPAGAKPISREQYAAMQETARAKKASAPATAAAAKDVLPAEPKKT